MPLLKPEEATSIHHEEATAQALFEEREAERLFTLQQQEQGSVMRRQPFESTGVGAAIGSSTLGVGALLFTKSPTVGAAAAVAGGIAGEAVEQAIFAQSGPGAITPGESVRGFAESGGAALAGEGAGVGLRFIGKQIPKYVQSRPLSPVQLERKRVLDQHAIPYLPHEITENGMGKFLSDVGEHAIFGPPGFKALRETQNDLQKLALHSVTDHLGKMVDPNDIGNAAVWAIKNEREVARTIANTMYNGVEDTLRYTTREVTEDTGGLVPRQTPLVGPRGEALQVPQQTTRTVTEGGLLADVSKTMEIFRPQLDEMISLEKTKPQLAAVLKEGDSFFNTAQTFALNDEPVQWNDAHKLLKKLHAEIRKIESPRRDIVQTGIGQEVGALKKIAAQLDADLTTALETSSDPRHVDALNQWNAARAFVRETSATLKNDTIKALVQTVQVQGGDKGMAKFINNMSADEMTRVLKATESPVTDFNSVAFKALEQNSPEMANLLREDPLALHNGLRRAFVIEGIERAGGRLGKADETVDPKALRNFLFGKTALTSRKAGVVIPPAQQAELGKLIDAIEGQQEMIKPGPTGRLFMQMKTSGALFTVAGATAGALVGAQVAPTETVLASVAILAAPRMLGNWMLNKDSTRLLAAAAKVQPGSSRSVQILKELMRVDKAFARTVQLTVSQALVGAHEGGPPARTAETTTLEPVSSLPSAFPLEK